MIGYDAQYAGAGALVGGTIGSAVPASAHSPVQGVGGAMGMAYTAANSEQGVLRRICWCRKTMRAITLTRRPFRRPPPCMACFPARWKWAAMRSCSSCSSPWAEQSGRLSAGGRARDAIREAAANRSLWPPCRAFAGGAGKAAAVEGAQEFAPGRDFHAD